MVIDIVEMYNNAQETKIILSNNQFVELYFFVYIVYLYIRFHLIYAPLQHFYDRKITRCVNIMQKL